MRILANLGISDSFGKAFKDVISDNQLVFDQHGIQFVSGVNIMKGITTGERMRENRIAKIEELHADRRELDVICMRSPSFFASPNLAINQDGTLLPQSSLFSSYMGHALVNFDLDIVLSIEPFPVFAFKNKDETFRRTLDILSRSELFRLSWRDSVIEICRNIPNARIHLVSDYTMQTIFPQFLKAMLPTFPDTDQIVKSAGFEKRMSRMARFSVPVAGLLASKAPPKDKAKIFVDIFSNGSPDTYFTQVANEIGVHATIIMGLIENYFADIEYLSDLKIDNLNTDFLG